MLKVMIVDDEINLCKCLMQLLPWAEMNCDKPVSVYDGLSAWERLRQEKFDFVICDIRMPIMNGSQLAKLISENNMQTQIVFLSAYEDFSVARQALQQGVIDYILKPINRESLKRLEEIIRGVYQTKKSQEFYELLQTKEYRKQIFDALDQRNIHFMETMFKGLELLEGQMLLNSGLNLVYVLYDYHSGAREEIAKSMDGTLYKKWRIDFLQRTTAEDRLEYLRSLYEKQMSQEQVAVENEFMVQRVKELVKKEYLYPECNVDGIAQKMNKSPAYLGRVFRNAMGVGLSEYITEIRIKRACELLARDIIPMNLVSEKVGYINPNYFAKKFRDKMGMSPSEYRKRYNS